MDELFRMGTAHINTELIPKCCSMCWLWNAKSVGQLISARRRYFRSGSGVIGEKSGGYAVTAMIADYGVGIS